MQNTAHAQTAHRSNVARRKVSALTYEFASLCCDIHDARRCYSDLARACRQRGLSNCSFDAFCGLVRQIRCSPSPDLADFDIAELGGSIGNVPSRFGGTHLHHIAREIDRRSTSLQDW